MYYILKGEFMGLKLEAYKATELFFENKLEGPNQQIQVKQRFNTRVNYFEEDKCACIYEVTVTDAEEKLPFKIVVEIVGIFSHSEMSKTDIHIEATRQLYPYLKSTVSLVTTLVGAPPFMLQQHVVAAEDITSETETLKS